MKKIILAAITAKIVEEIASAVIDGGKAKLPAIRDFVGKHVQRAGVAISTKPISEIIKDLL